MSRKIWLATLTCSFFVSAGLSSATNNSYSANSTQSPSKDNAAGLRVNIQKEGSRTQSVGPFEKGPYNSDAAAENQQILNDIQDMIKGSYRRYNINIHIYDGVVTLDGIVNTSEDKKNIENQVLKINGVKKVNNRIDVKKSSPSDNNSKNSK